jgi:hypothetical protein
MTLGNSDSLRIIIFSLFILLCTKGSFAFRPFRMFEEHRVLVSGLELMKLPEGIALRSKTNCTRRAHRHGDRWLFNLRT